ncbi:MAG: hypothetical protein ACRDS9_00935 [Pseudonocardiaceae bacterium]
MCPIPHGGPLMWATHTAGARILDRERVESAARARTALGLTLANQVAEGRDPEDLIVEEFRAATLEHNKVARLSDYGATTDSPGPSDLTLGDVEIIRRARLGRM